MHFNFHKPNSATNNWFKRRKNGNSPTTPWTSKKDHRASNASGKLNQLILTLWSDFSIYFNYSVFNCEYFFHLILFSCQRFISNRLYSIRIQNYFFKIKKQQDQFQRMNKKLSFKSSMKARKHFNFLNVIFFPKKLQCFISQIHLILHFFFIILPQFLLMDEKNRKQHQISSSMQEISICRVNIPFKNQVLYSILQRLQQQCSRELEKNQKLIFSYLWNKEKSVQTNFVSDFSFEQKEGTDKQRQESEKNQQFFEQKNGTIQEEVAQEYLEQDLSPSSFQPKGQKKRYRASESKNVPKNYSKAIFSFMRKNMNITRKVLKKYHIRERDFKKSIERYRGKINTIMELRSIWIQQTNPYAKAYRVLSALYMRKYSLSKIFNSRIEYHMRNLKYRYRVFDGIQNPQSLTHMKDY